jgi:DNA-binding response OmpR family regulator
VTAPTVLVVDDDPVITQLLRVSFELEGYRVVTAADGAAGLRRAVDEAPDVVLFDVMMPGVDGLAAAAALRADDRVDAVTVLLSAKAQAEDVTAGLAVADAYVTKPFDPFELLDRVASLLAARRAAHA